MSEKIDALFISHWVDVDRWHNDGEGLARPSVARARARLNALDESEWMKDEVDLVVEGRVLDFSRFLSWVRYGTTAEWRRYDPFTITLLSGTYYLNLLSRHGVEVRVANLASQQNLDALAARYAPRFVLLSTTLMFDAAEFSVIPKAIELLRSRFPQARIVLGGLLLVSREKNVPPEEFRGMLLHYGADAYVVTPRGEAPLLEILRSSSQAALAASPPPATYVVHQGIVHGPATRPEPPLSLEDGSIRWGALPQIDHLYHTVHTRTARSCAFACAFCEYPVNQGPLTLMPTEVVDRELRELARLGRVRSLIFTDDTFNVPITRFRELLRVLARYDFEWYSFFRPQYADAETARLMREAGCRGVFAGLESADDQILRNMNKKATADQYKRGLEHVMRQGIRIHANFIVGFPGETEATARKTISFLDQTGIEFSTVCIWSFIPSAPIGQRRQTFGIDGWGVQWKHYTMDSKQAQQLARQIVAEQKRSVHNAVRGECWTEFLLYANGLELDEVRLAVSTFNSFLGRDVSEREVRSSASYAALRATLQRHEVPAPAPV